MCWSASSGATPGLIDAQDEEYRRGSSGAGNYERCSWVSTTSSPPAISGRDVPERAVVHSPCILGDCHTVVLSSARSRKKKKVDLRRRAFEPVITRLVLLLRFTFVSRMSRCSSCHSVVCHESTSDLHSPRVVVDMRGGLFAYSQQLDRSDCSTLINKIASYSWIERD